jgi:hypothetical protein
MLDNCQPRWAALCCASIQFGAIVMAIFVASRFNGPPNSGNGGYCAGLIASATGETVAVRLHQPVPLERELVLSERIGDKWEVRAGEDLIASARPATVEIEVPAAPTYAQALEASKRFAGHKHHDRIASSAAQLANATTGCVSSPAP